MWGAIFAGAMLLLYIFWEPVRHFYRNRKLKKPCKVYFIIRSADSWTSDYAIQDDYDHHLNEIVVPANSQVNIEIMYEPLVHFYEQEISFGCPGNNDLKPFVEKQFTKYVEQPAKSSWVHGEDGHYRDIHKFWHAPRKKSRNVGSHFVVGFELKVRAAGRYKAILSFLTDEIEGNAELFITVEDKPTTKMRCFEHSGCFVSPLNKNDHA